MACPGSKTLLGSVARKWREEDRAGECRSKGLPDSHFHVG